MMFWLVGDPGAASRQEEIFAGESLQQQQQQQQQQQPLLCKLSPTEIPSCRLAAPGSPTNQNIIREI